MPALKAVDLAGFARSHGRLIDEGWIDAAKAAAPNGLD